jgi:hypothetical protein
MTTDQPYVFTNDNPLNFEDPLGLKKTVKEKIQIACFSVACLGASLGLVPSPGKVHIPQPAGSEDNRRVIDDQKGVGPHRNPDAPKMVPVTQSASLGANQTQYYVPSSELIGAGAIIVIVGTVVWLFNGFKWLGTDFG